jgi:hypothetical protein
MKNLGMHQKEVHQKRTIKLLTFFPASTSETSAPTDKIWHKE